MKLPSVGQNRMKSRAQPRLFHVLNINPRPVDGILNLFAGQLALLGEIGDEGRREVAIFFSAAILPTGTFFSPSKRLFRLRNSFSPTDGSSAAEAVPSFGPIPPEPPSYVPLCLHVLPPVLLGKADFFRHPVRVRHPRDAGDDPVGRILAIERHHEALSLLRLHEPVHQ